MAILRAASYFTFAAIISAIYRAARWRGQHISHLLKCWFELLMSLSRVYSWALSLICASNMSVRISNISSHGSFHSWRIVTKTLYLTYACFGIQKSHIFVPHTPSQKVSSARALHQREFFPQISHFERVISRARFTYGILWRPALPKQCQRPWSSTPQPFEWLATEKHVMPWDRKARRRVCSAEYDFWSQLSTFTAKFLPPKTDSTTEITNQFPPGITR